MIRHTVTSDGATIELENMDDWAEFVELNEQTIIDDYGSIENAYAAAVQGGLRFGGGAMPIADVYFAD